MTTINTESIKAARVQTTEAGAKSYSGRSEFIKALIDDTADLNTAGLLKQLQTGKGEEYKSACNQIAEACKAKYPQNASRKHIEETIVAYLARLQKAEQKRLEEATAAKTATVKPAKTAKQTKTAKSKKSASKAKQSAKKSAPAKTATVTPALEVAAAQ
jgi:hypothetical protein